MPKHALSRIEFANKQGSHNLWVADLNADDMPDIMRKHYERGSALEVWYNTLVKPAVPRK